MDVGSRHEPSRAAGAPGAANISAPGMMLLATAILYPCVLAALCLGAGLLVEKVSGAPLASTLLLSVGVAALIAVTQLTTLVSAIAPASPYVVLAVALAGVALAPARLAAIFHRARAAPLLPATQVAVYAIAMAPVLLAGRASFSSFMALSDSAVHMMGADYLIHHGQSYAHLDLANSYGRFINAYYGTSYPSGADTLFGASGLLLRLPLIWAFQPFNAFVLATACGPVWLLARQLGLRGPWRALAAITTVLPALVYGYELLGSVKEITALSMLLASGAVVASPGSWLRQGPRGAIPLALLLAAGISALGAAYGVWALAALVVLAAALPAELRSRRVRPGAVLLLALVGVITGLVAALPTWRGLGGSIQIAGNIASTSNPGNLHSPLHAVQVLGVWLNGSYKLEPTGTSGVITDALLVLAGVAAVLGVAQLLRRRQWGLAGWIAMTLLAWLVVSRAVTTWASAKTLMLTSPEVLLLAWGGVALLKGRSRATLAAGGVALALALTAGVLVSDEMQYRSSDLAPTTRYQELANVNTRFAGKGPALVTDFDEYPLYVLRDLDIGGPNFVYPPPTLASAAGGYGDPVDLGRIPPRALLAYPLIVTRRDPTSTRPPGGVRGGVARFLLRGLAPPPRRPGGDRPRGDSPDRRRSSAVRLPPSRVGPAQRGTRSRSPRLPRSCTFRSPAPGAPPGGGASEKGS